MIYTVSADALWTSPGVIKSVDSCDPRVTVLISFALQFSHPMEVWGNTYDYPRAAR